MKKLILLSFTILFLFSGCNIFDPFDNPSSDDELLSAARACLDQGDYECARRYYGQVSSAASDDMHSEMAFLTLDEHGVGLSGFLSALGSGNVSGGKLFTVMANHIGATATTAKRSALHGAFRRTEFIQLPQLRGLVRFLTSVTLLGHILAEVRSNGGEVTFDKNDIVSDATACTNGELAGCAASCTALLPAGSTITDVFSSASFEGSVSLTMIQALVTQLSTALTSELDAGGKFSSGSLSFVSELNNPLYTPAISPACFSYLLISNGLGDQ